MADNNQQESGWIQNAIKRPGEFTRKAEQRRMSPADFQERVLTNPDRYDPRTVKQARFRKVLAAIRKKKTS